MNRRTIIHALCAASMVAACTACGGTAKHSASPTTAIPSASTSTGVGTSSSSPADPAVAAGRDLVVRIIDPPYGYAVDQTAGATGAITPEIFASAGGVSAPTAAGFVAGYKQNYVDTDTSEGITVTILRFSSAASASSYFRATASRTLSFAAATSKPFPIVPGAIEVDGTKQYDGVYEHGVVMSRGAFYVSLVYVTAMPVPIPVEFDDWAKVQYQML